MTSSYENYSWYDISSAPKDGSLVDLCWRDDGEIQEVFEGMEWSEMAGNDLVGVDCGIWAIISNKEVLLTWAEGLNGPTHWKFHNAKPNKFN